MAQSSGRQQCPRCERWGELVDLEGHRICEDCYGRLTGIERTPPTVFNVIAGTSTVIGRLALPAIAIVALGALPLHALRQAVFDVPPIVDWALGVLLQGVFLHMAHRAIREQPLQIERSARTAWDAFLRLLRTSFFVHFQVGAILVVFAIAGLVVSLAAQSAFGLVALVLLFLIGAALAAWRASSLAVALPVELHEHPSSSLRTSTNRMSKHRPAALMFAVAGMIAAVLPIASYAALWVASVVASIQHGTDLSQLTEITGMAELAAAVSSSALGLLTTTVSAVLYAKTASYRIY